MPASGRPWAKSSPASARWNGRGSAAAAIWASSSARAASGLRISSRNCASVSAGCGSSGRARRGGAQHRLGAVGVALAQVPLDQAAPHPGVVGEELGHAGELGAGAGHVAGRLERGEAHQVQALVLGRLRQRRVDDRERLRRRAGVEAVGDQHHLGHDVAGGLGDHRLGHRHRLGAGRRMAEVDGRLERADHRVGRRLDEGLGGVLLGGGEVLHLERDLDDGALRLEVGRVLVGHPQVLPHRLAGDAARALDAGEGEPRRDMVAVEAEDVAELDQRPVGVALGEQRHAALVVPLGPLLGAVAGGEPEQGGKDQHRPERPEGGAHRRLRVRFLSAGVRSPAAGGHI